MSLFIELRRRNVFRVAAAYAVTAWLLLQAGDILLGNFGAPDWVFKSLVGVLVLGFPSVLAFSWAYEITPEGIRRERDVTPDESITRITARRLDQITIVMIVLSLAVLAVDRIWLGRPAPIAARPTIATDAPAPAPGTERSIAVLPFADMSPNKDQEYFSDGLSEEILNLLAQIKALKVIGRTSSFAFKGKNVDLREIGETLGVAYLLEGSVRKAGDDLRITAQLIETDTGSHLWSESYDRQLENVFAIQSDIAEAIVDALQLNLVGQDAAVPVAQPAASMPAYERYLQARRLIQGRTRSGLEAARELLDEALKLDPDYAPAHAAAAKAVLLLADTQNTYGDIPLEQAVAAAQRLIDRALALDPNLAEAHAVQGLLYMSTADLERSTAALARALELNPGLTGALHARAFNLWIAGRLHEAVAARRRLATVDPLHLINQLNLAVLLSHSGEAEEAEALTRQIQRGFPENPHGFNRQAEVLYRTGRLAAAREPAEKALAMEFRDTYTQEVAGRIFYALGDHDGVLALPWAYEHGTALLALGRVDEALATARERSTASTGDLHEADQLLRTLSLAGRHDEVLAVYRERWGHLEGLETVFDRLSGVRVMAAIAAAQRALDRHEALANTVRHWGQRLAFLREHGFAAARFRSLEASRLALSGAPEDALAALAEAIELGWREPLLARDPAFAPIADDPAFQAQVQRMTDLINAERAKLGMEPLP